MAKSAAERQKEYRVRQKTGEIRVVTSSGGRIVGPVERLREDVDTLSGQVEDLTRRLAKIEELADQRR